MKQEKTCNEIPEWVKVIMACWLYVFAAGQVVATIIHDDMLDSTVVFSIRIILICIGVFILGQVVFAISRLISQALRNNGETSIHLNNLLGRAVLQLFVLNNSSKMLKCFYYGSFATYSIASIVLLMTI